MQFNMNNQSFEEMWNNCSTTEQSEQDEQIFASMEPHRVRFAMTSRSDKRMAMVYRRLHASNAVEASNSMEMIYTRTICRMCLMPVQVCRTYGYNLKRYDLEQEEDDKDAYDRRLRKYLMMQK
ncbi:PREDICTED: uncharacterized protein LOC108609623 [Drosophila arizonae]|uniref:Uncharacterized protein LOC108609623 n=1 Tax=Drosophila arizonae TaxID=7263 RepID=A0ABM1NPE7_DROAR|nr:PREDICTED: uncharacterized protein LOC108609623 [Drosophila arizonae]